MSFIKHVKEFGQFTKNMNISEHKRILKKGKKTGPFTDVLHLKVTVWSSTEHNSSLKVS